jgi:acetyl esterase/lipase
MGRRLLLIAARVVVYGIIVVATAALTILAYNFHMRTALHAPLTTQWNNEVGEEVNDLRYDKGDFGDYDLYLPAHAKPHALILFIHGGGFTGGDKHDEQAWCRFFTSKGYVTASMNYSLADGKHESNINKMYQEMLQCVKAIKQECARRGIRLTSMATSGQSAGGCLAMLYAYKSGQNSVVPVRCVFQQTGPVSFEPEAWGNGSAQDKANFVSLMTGHTVTVEMIKNGKYHDLVDEISPVAFVDSTSVPTVLAYGPKDKVVPAKLKFKLIDRLKQFGVTYDYVEYSHSGHALLDDPDKQQLFVDKALKYCHKYLR